MVQLGTTNNILNQIEDEHPQDNTGQRNLLVAVDIEKETNAGVQLTLPDGIRHRFQGPGTQYRVPLGRAELASGETMTVGVWSKDGADATAWINTMAVLPDA